MIPTTLNKLITGLTVGTSLVLVAGAAGQDIAVTVTNSEFPDSPPPVVSDSDLLETAFDFYDGSDLTTVRGQTVTGESALRNGIWDNNGQSRGDTGVDPDDFAVFNLDLVASPGGYTITGVDLYSNWGTGQGRDEIRVQVSFSLVDTPTVFDQILGTGTDPDFDPLFVYNPPTQTQGKTSLSGFSVPGVAAIRFDWPSPQENQAVGYSEIDVFGTSTGGDIDPPTLSNTSPVTGAIDIATSTEIVLTFNEDIAAGTGNIDLRSSTPDASFETFDVSSSSQLAFAGRELTITPTTPLATGVEYFLVVPLGAIADTSGNDFLGIAALPDPNALSFITDNTPPTLAIEEILLNGLPDSDLTIDFNEAVMAGTGNLSLHASDDSVIETIDVTSAAVTADGSTIRIEIADLEMGNDYYLNYPAGAFVDLSANPAEAVSDTTTLAFATAATTLIHHWQFEGDGTDTEGTHDGNLQGGASIVEGLFGMALQTGPTGGLLNVGRASLPATNFTMSAWVSIDLATGVKHIVGTQRAGSGGARIESRGGRPVAVLEGETPIEIPAPELLVTGEWTHLAITVDETGGMILYVNGANVGEEATGTTHNVEANFQIGRRPDVVQPSFSGLTDEVRIYSEVLTPAQVAALAVAPSVAGPTLVVSQNGDLLDFSWNSQSGMQYDLVSSIDLLTEPSTWSLYNDGSTTYENIVSAGTTTTLSNLGRVGPTRFFAVIAEEIPPILSADFESGTVPTGWVVTDNGTGTTWEVGTPTTGPTAAANGVNCVGTNLGNYVDGADTTLTSPAFATPAGGATLSFEQFLDTDEETGGSDVGSIRLLDADNADAEIVAESFPVTPIEGFGGGWTMESYALPADALGKNIKVQFQFVSNSDGTNFGGIYLDDIAVTP